MNLAKYFRAKHARRPPNQKPNTSTNQKAKRALALEYSTELGRSTYIGNLYLVSETSNPICTF